MKYFFVSTLCLIFFTATFAQKGIRLKKLVNKKSSPYSNMPLSMVQIPTGTFVMGDKTDTSTILKREQGKSVLISGFYISTSEVTNAQYREFVDWVRDSIAARLLGGSYINENAGDTTINWKLASKINYADNDVLAKLEPLLSDPAKTLGNRRVIDPEKLIYAMRGFNYQEAAKLENKGRNPNEFFYKYDVKVYPDTLCWMRDFGYSNNEQMAVSYYHSSKYVNYPVVGVSWKQANAYCDWMTKHKIHVLQNKNKLSEGGKCRLPTEAEWEYASALNSGLTSDQVQERRGLFNRNRNNKEENPTSAKDEKIFPIYVNYGSSGKIGLYNMEDNVSEWTVTSYYEAGENFQNRFNPDIQWGTPDSESRYKRRKVVRGGSWKDTPMFKNTENHFYEDMDATHSYLGFRIVLNLPE